MHTLTKLLLLGASATVILAQQVIPQIKFCKEKDLGGECYTQPLEAEKCVLIPDSNATGDKGSSYTVSRIRTLPFAVISC